MPRRTTSPTPTSIINRRHLVAESGKLLLGLGVNVGGLLGLSQLPASGLLALVECSALDLPSLLKAVKEFVRI